MRDVPPGPSPASGPPPAPGTSDVPGTSDAADAARTAPGDGRTGVVVITRDRRERLLHTLERLTALPERPPVVVVDNASSDGTARAVRERFPQARLLTPGRNLGAVGRNLAARVTTTPYLAFCDDDSWWEPGALAGAADLLDAHRQVAAVTARILVHPVPHAPQDPHEPQDPHAPQDPHEPQDPYAPPGAVAQGDPYEDPVVPELRHSPLPAPDWLPGPALGSFLAAATVLRTDAFREADGFSPRLWLGGEEELLAADLAASGWWLVHADNLTVHHRPAPRRDSTLRRRHGIRNTLWFGWLRRPAPAAVRRTVRLAASVPRDTVSARAFAEALAGLPWVLRERRPLPAEVEERFRLLEEAQNASTARRYVG
ncbi:glycosyltransferase [Streptomyces sp. SCUT-3]|uniref:glycosyltransferase family 2 protein n=1 Tax=Streptomyces sp. SCUT-3 TaxID=2684469 RepID=UPI0015FA1FF0|nr:glycosyltransferase [Streptomyces sp. SCUT-3]QMV24126.1 glycosyltransferase [Streptomyces sp. SCUT-3]